MSVGEKQAKPVLPALNVLAQYLPPIVKPTYYGQEKQRH